MHRSGSRLQALMAALSLLGLLAACGGQVSGGGTAGDRTGDGGTGNGGSSGGGGSSGSSGSSSSGSGSGSGGTTTGGSGGSCVTVPASSFSRSCSTAADCTLVTTGTLCSGSCDCGDTPISNAALGQYNADVASITFDECPCAFPGVAACVNGTCTRCGAPGSAACAPSVDAGPSSDGGACVDLEPSMFDTSCKVSSDCVDVTLGALCESGCLCGGSTINVADEGKYKMLTAGIPPGGALCSCPYLGSPVCAAGQCIVCGGAAPPNAACPDAGP